jgi:hypothetical protein
MITKQSQIDKIKEQLFTNGYVSRNWALSNFIGRLASRMTDLKDSGLKFKGKNYKTENGIDYRYYLIEDEPSN